MDTIALKPCKLNWIMLSIAYMALFLKTLMEDTNSEKAPSNKTPALAKSMNMDICVVGTSNQLFARGS